MSLAQRLSFASNLLRGLSLVLAGCGVAATAEEVRPLVCVHPTIMADLYWTGSMNDYHGNRWDVDIIPGITPTAKIVGRSWHRAYRDIADTGLRDNGEESLTRAAFHFGGRDVIRDFTVHGVRDDYVKTSHQIRDLWHETPFGWYAQVIGRSFWGYVAKPVGRIIGGSVTGTGAFIVGTLAGSLEGTGRVVLATGDVVAIGTVYPAGRLAWQQPAWLFSIVNREPDLNQDGHWGLHVVKYGTNPEPKL
jgi:hypothetical protein